MQNKGLSQRCSITLCYVCQALPVASISKSNPSVKFSATLECLSLLFCTHSIASILDHWLSFYTLNHLPNPLHFNLSQNISYKCLLFYPYAIFIPSLDVMSIIFHSIFCCFGQYIRNYLHHYNREVLKS